MGRRESEAAAVRAPHSIDQQPDTMALITSDCDAMRSPGIKRPESPRHCACPSRIRGSLALSGRALANTAMPALAALQVVYSRTPDGQSLLQL